MSNIKNMQAFKAGMISLIVGGAMVYFGIGLSIPTLGYVALVAACGCFINAFSPREGI